MLPVFSRTCCSEELSVTKSSLSGTLAPEEGSFGILGSQEAIWEKLLQHHRNVVSSSCPTLAIEKERLSLEGDRWSDIHEHFNLLSCL